jgi:hypothetical protein
MRMSESTRADLVEKCTEYLGSEPGKCTFRCARRMAAVARRPGRLYFVMLVMELEDCDWRSALVRVLEGERGETHPGGGPRGGCACRRPD